MVPIRVSVMQACHLRLVSLLLASRNLLICHNSPAPVTRPHSSANSLRKPFKTPFKTPFKAPSASHVQVAREKHQDRTPEHGVVSPRNTDRPTPKDEESEGDIEIVDVRIKQEPDAADDQGIPH